MPTNHEAQISGPDEPDEPSVRGVHPAFIYAFERLGYLVTETNAGNFSTEDIKAWNEAVDEGERRFGPIGE